MTKYEDFLSTDIVDLDIETLPDDDQFCGICRFPYEPNASNTVPEDIDTDNLACLRELPWTSTYAHGDAVLLPCNHHFDAECLLRATEIGNTNLCPLCRCVLFLPPFGMRLDSAENPMALYGDLLALNALPTRVFLMERPSAEPDRSEMMKVYAHSMTGRLLEMMAEVAERFDRTGSPKASWTQAEKDVARVLLRRAFVVPHDLGVESRRALRATPWLPPFLRFLADARVYRQFNRWSSVLRRLNESCKTPRELLEALNEVILQPLHDGLFNTPRFHRWAALTTRFFVSWHVEQQSFTNEEVLRLANLIAQTRGSGPWGDIGEYEQLLRWYACI
ncbi:hypothetical protein BU16DRAFT_557857 [Lophium mytilinum]|uniref:RING-type domain-containing protein n=1 Tax=Lophium mytilinum TaxID=390894 RepID=A0A6A6R4S7_9PEZI|nr:hypothetical protein BU16DRAFT_557857 [Lophium mytilinum]